MAENLGHSWSRLWVPGSGLGSPFGLPFEQLTAQIASAVERALREPTRYDALVRIFAPASSLTMRRDGGRLPREEGSPVVLQDAAQEVFMSVDQLQTRLSGDWRHTIQLTACVVSGVFAILLVEVGEQPGHVIWYILASLIFGGFIAWLARDLTAIVEHLRR